MSILERQAGRALERELQPGEIVRGFTPCTFFNGRRVLQAFATSSSQQTNAFFAWSSGRLFLIPPRVRDIMPMTINQLEALEISSDGRQLDIRVESSGRNIPIRLTLQDATVGKGLMSYWLQYLEEAAEVFEETLHTPAFDARTITEMRTQLRAGQSRHDAAETVGRLVYLSIREQTQIKAIASAAAFAAEKMAMGVNLEDPATP